MTVKYLLTTVRASWSKAQTYNTIMDPKEVADRVLKICGGGHCEDQVRKAMALQTALYDGQIVIHPSDSKVTLSLYRLPPSFQVSIRDLNDLGFRVTDRYQVWLPGTGRPLGRFNRITEAVQFVERDLGGSLVPDTKIWEVGKELITG